MLRQTMISTTASRSIASSAPIDCSRGMSWFSKNNVEAWCNVCVSACSAPSLLRPAL
jgi:hypothetical protein